MYQPLGAPTSASAPSDKLLTPPFVLMLCVQFCFGLSYSSFFLLPKFLARELHADASVIGVVAATALIAGVLATPWLGSALDRGRRAPFMTGGALVNAISGAAFAFVHSVSWPIFALRAVHGVSYALVFNATVTLATDLAPPKKLGQAIGLCGAAGMVANAIAPALAEWIADHRGWGLVFWLAGGAALLASLLALFIREPRDAELRHAAHAAMTQHVAVAPAENALVLIRDSGRWGAFICGAANGAAFGVMFTFTQPFALSLGASQVSSFFVGYTLCALAVRLFLGTLADTWGRQRVACAALLLYGLVAALASLLRPNLLFAIGAGLGLAHGLLYPALNALAIEGVSRARRGAVMSYFFGCFNAGFALWVTGLGLVAKSQGYPLVFLATGVLVGTAALFLPKKAQRLVA